MAERRPWAGLDTLFLVISVVGGVVLIYGLCALAFGWTANWATPLSAACTLAVGVTNLVIRRRSR